MGVSVLFYLFVLIRWARYHLLACLLKSALERWSLLRSGTCVGLRLVSCGYHEAGPSTAAGGASFRGRMDP